MSTLFALTVLFAVLAAVALVLALRSFRNRAGFRGSAGTLIGLLFVALAALSATLSIATNGYRALTHEEVAAVVEVEPTGEHAFSATVHRPGEPPRTFRVRGDQVYVDARILKWEPFLNVLGLHTSYELNRLAGRYEEIAMAKNAPRSVYALGDDRMVDAFALVEKFPALRYLVDAEYGSATFVEVERSRRLEVRVSTSGLLIREASPETTPDELVPGGNDGT